MMNETPEAALRSRIADLEQQLKLADKGTSRLAQRCLELEKQLHPDNLHVTENISIVAAVGRKMAFRPGTSGRIFAALGEHGINIRMISQGPDELNIIVGVDTKDFAPAIQVLYNSFVK